MHTLARRLASTVRLHAWTTLSKACKPEAVREFALSLTYFGHLRRRHRVAKVALLVCAAAVALLSLTYPAWDLQYLAIATIGSLD